MDIRNLRYFLAVAQELNFTRAATKLHMSQPPLTRRIQALEAELGVQLFERTARGVTLTQAGATLLEDAKHIELLAEQASARVKSTSKGQVGRLDLGVFGTAMFDVVPRVLNAYTKRYPNVNLVLHHGSTPTQVTALAQNRIHAFFERQIPEDAGITRRLVASETCMLVLPENHPLTRYRRVPARSLRGVTMISGGALGSQISRLGEKLCQAHGFEPTRGPRVSDVIMGMMHVACGMGCMVVPRSACNVQMPGLLFRPISTSHKLFSELYCFHRPHDESPLLAALLETIEQIQPRR
jgi:LysR family transcriptional regulator, benzoate and cis,cis-muconate-responsive activator of ben and cat genes